MEEMDIENKKDEDKSLCEDLEDNEEVKSKLIENETEENMDDEFDDDQDKEDDEEDADEAEVKALETSLAQNPYDYTNHVALVNKLQKMGELERLRAARENMSTKYPLSPELWLSWMRDEIKLAVTPEQKSEIVKICERAVKDYLCVEVWLEYLQFSIGNMGTEKDAAKNVRQLFERALTDVGLHIIKGAIIWEAFREFEAVLYALIDPSNQAERKEQLERIGNLFKRQLACPLLDMEKTYEEYETWRHGDGAEAIIDDKIIIIGYERALAMLNLRLPYEERIVSAQTEEELLDSYKMYLSYEQRSGDPGRITVLYERAITDLSLEISIWLDYIKYLEENIKIESVLDQVYQRSSRNIPWCANIWQKWMRSYEKWSKPILEIQILLENALVTGFSTAEDYRNLWITYLEYLRRRIDRFSSNEEKQLETLRNTFNRACEHLAKSFGLEGDPNCILLQYWARTEAIHGNNMEKARSLWADILSQGHSTTASYWLEYISLERCYGDTKHLRKLFQKALTSVKDWPESIASSWLDFERDEGTLEQMEICETRTKEKLEKIAEERQKTQQIPNRELSPIQNKKAFKRKQEETGKWKNLSNFPIKITKVETQMKPKMKENHVNFEKRLEKKLDVDVEQTSKIIPPPGFKAPEDEKLEIDNTQEMDDKITVFVSNLDYTATEEEVRNALKPAGPITMFKMIRDYKGRSKGFCYVQLSSTEAVDKALQLDRVSIRGRPMFVSKCDPNKMTRSSGFKYSCSLEKNKLFVKGLSVSTTKEDLEEICKVYGVLKEVRIVTYRNGHSKGLAYVEFEDESSAAKALLAIDGMKIGDKVISVAISQPPERKKVPIKSLGGTTVSRTTFGMPKTLLSMVPRIVKTAATNGSATITGNGVAPKMSNQDFRNMLLNKK
ncbi:Squamous cell carcinoma antigen recognized by T-cells 3 [Melipona quadrifasciata]|uniref:Squamous cell carcinoma antigen recognized by T-cells 3 n=1 Tax=Melipona quadrifasciata TaxID=166423 RepID=A0A0M9A4Y2_9HYME|nr:Squamous cell carcinoma antigen recognized by T-cells 3 [Melipona quadrifasciata]